MPKLTIKEVEKKTTKGGKPYLLVKSSSDKYYYVWDKVQYIWHLMVVGATIEPTIATEGKFSSITGIVGLEGESPVEDKREALPSFNNWLTEKIKAMDAKLDFLVEERKTLKSTIAMDTLPRLEDLPVHELEDKDDIKVSEIPF